ncbi:MAG: hypothetical protein IPP53_17495 [Bacteroidetes bacterium]|nr:hypothetical protein [Bacteroidota bacterium]
MGSWFVRFDGFFGSWRLQNFYFIKFVSILCGIPSPKDDISGKDVGKVYWNEHGWSASKTYCQKDVLTVAQIV